MKKRSGKAGLWQFLIAGFLSAMTAPVTGESLRMESGAELYKTYCWQCHGMRGDGMGVNVRDMSVQPRDHTDGKEMAGRTDEELFRAIKEGGQAVSKSVLMPPWGGNLSDEEIESIVSYLRELCKCKYGSG